MAFAQFYQFFEDFFSGSLLTFLRFALQCKEVVLDVLSKLNFTN